MCGRLFVAHGNQGRRQTVCSNKCRNKRNTLSPGYAEQKIRARQKAIVSGAHADSQRRYRQKHAARLRPLDAARLRKRQPRRQPQRVTEAKRKMRRAVRGTSGKKWLWAQGDCLRCGTSFLGAANGAIPAYCSKQCSQADAGARRRALRKGAFVERVWRARVFDRDGWRCQLCGKPVKRTAAVPHPKAPVLDHIIPLAVGGTHEPANVQCAHFRCNSIKSHGIYGAGDQLRLIG